LCERQTAANELGGTADELLISKPNSVTSESIHCESKKTCRCGHSLLRSAARGDLQVPRIKTNFGSRAFAVSGPMFWNRLPPEIWTNDSLQSFKSQLKTYYFWPITSSAGALELDCMLWCLRSQRVIIIIIIITSVGRLLCYISKFPSCVN